MNGKFWFVVLLLIVVLMAGCGKEAGEKPKEVKLETRMGDIVLELNEDAAPVTVKNFLTYVEEGFYDGIIFHRVVPRFMIQAGGFTPDLKDKEGHPPIVNEFRLSNLRGTVAMAKVGGKPNSATSQFFINIADNGRLDNQNGGFTVFAKVVEGMDVVDAIAAVKTMRKSSRFPSIPIEPVVIKSAKVVSGK